ncbi:MAG: hypothetical protein AAF414_09495 [Pseudomonadota bacterium]
MNPHRKLLSGIAFGLSASLSLPAFAQNGDACQPFTVVSDGSDRTVDYIDNGAPGPSAGDQRIGYRSLADQDGNPVGHYRWIGTVLNQPGDDGTVGESVYEYIMALGDGHIGYHRLVQTDSPAQDTSGVAWDTTQSAIVTGGTGAYAFAHGTVTISRDDMVVTMEFDIACDD